MVFQSYALFPHMNVFDNVAFGLRRKSDAQGGGHRPRQRDPRHRRPGRLREKRRPREMSGGQQQRVALARALVNRPRALLLDEPLGALDLKLRQAMQIELKRIQREVGITFVYVTHDQGEALTMSDRIAVMNDRRDRAAGQPARHLRTAGHQVRGRLHRHLQPAVRRRQPHQAGGIAVIEPGRRAADPRGRRAGRPPPGTPSRSPCGRRRSRCRPHAPPAGACALRGTVSEVVYLGTSTSYNVATSIGAEVDGLRAERPQRRATRQDAGDAVWLSLGARSLLRDRERRMTVPRKPDPRPRKPDPRPRGHDARPRLSRRNVLRFGGLSAAGLALAACGVQGAAPKQQTSKQALTAAQQFWKAQKPTAHVNFANWPLYIDPQPRHARAVHGGDRHQGELPRRSSRTTRRSSPRSTRSSGPARTPATT